MLLLNGRSDMSIPSQRGTETSNLANVIEVIQLGRKTGILTVERGDDAQLELGEITFTNGQITQARSNHSRSTDGQQALQWLRTWRSCRFLFVPSGKSDRTTHPLPAVRDGGLTQRKRDTQSHLVPPTMQTSDQGSESDDFSTVPQRILYAEKALHIIENAHLSRTHRQLFLLIDGQRNVAELLRLLGRKQDEGLKLLRDLAYIGVIR